MLMSDLPLRSPETLRTLCNDISANLSATLASEFAETLEVPDLRHTLNGVRGNPYLARAIFMTTGEVGTPEGGDMPTLQLAIIANSYQLNAENVTSIPPPTDDYRPPRGDSITLRVFDNRLGAVFRGVLEFGTDPLQVRGVSYTSNSVGFRRAAGQSSNWLNRLYGEVVDDRVPLHPDFRRSFDTFQTVGLTQQTGRLDRPVIERLQAGTDPEVKWLSRRFDIVRASASYFDRLIGRIMDPAALYDALGNLRYQSN